MNCHEEIINYMHDYLDEDIKPEHKEILRDHLLTVLNAGIIFMK